MKQREAKFGIKLRHYYKMLKPATSALELKQSVTDSLPFSDVAEGQINYALAIESDEGVMIRVVGWNGEPDYIWLRCEPAYILIQYPDCFVAIRVHDFVDERDKSDRKSLTSVRAREICEFFEMS